MKDVERPVAPPTSCAPQATELPAGAICCAGSVKAPLGALILDAEERITACSTALEENLKYPAGGLLGTSAASLVAEFVHVPCGQPTVVTIRRGDGSCGPVELWKVRLGGKTQALLCVIADRRRVRLEERAWLQSEAALTAIHSIPFPLWVIAADGHCAMQNEASRRQWGDLVGKPPSRSGLPEAAEREWQTNVQSALAGEHIDHEWRYGDASGTHVRQNIVVPVTVDQRTIGAVGVSVDLTERKHAQAVLERLRHLFETANFGMAVTGPSGAELSMVNAAFARMHGYATDELVGKPVAETFVPGARAALRAHLKQARAHGHAAFESLALRRDGRSFPVLVDVSTGVDETGEVLYQAIAVRNISERVKAADRVAYLASHDSLTGLFNRSAMVEEIEQRLTEDARFCLCMIDLDRFKVVNDSLGHHAGDLLLAALATRLRERFPYERAVFRLGGDEFGLLLALAPDQDPLPAVRVVAAVIAEPCLVEQTSLANRCSIGVSVFPDDADCLETILRNASIAMYRAKHLGGNTVVCFSGERRSDARSRLALETDLRTAALNGQLVLHYEPKVALAHGARICGMEVLLRWNHPLLGRVSPGLFIPLAEETGLIGAVGEWVLESACRQNVTWLGRGHPPLRMAVNLSARQFNPRLPGTLKRILEQTRHPPELLELEITESTLILNVDEALAIMRELTTLGVNLSVDDFGTGYSALAYLKHFPVSSLKLNESFIRGVAERTEDHAIVQAVIALAHALRLSVVAECVEQPAQLEALRALGCDQAQGHLFGAPVPADSFEHLLSEASLKSG